MKKLEIFLSSIMFLFLFFFLSQKECFGETKSFVTIVNPIRGEYSWGLKTYGPLSFVILQKKVIDENNLSSTWLLREDAVISVPISSYLKTFSTNHELGLFLEIIPLLATRAEVPYPSGGTFWHDSNKIFLSGYKPEDREKLIRTAFEDFKEKFGYYPKSVGAWHIDAYSARIMKEKYSVTGVLICSDQFTTDGYQIWGGFWGVPFYPSKFNILMPAQTLKNKLDLVVSWWAARDPDLGYGGSGEESTYSVQANDYLYHGLKIDYFSKLLDYYLNNPNNKFGQVTIGLENDNDDDIYGSEYKLQIEEVKRREKIREINVLTMKGFSEWYQKQFKLSLEHQIGDWLMTRDFRIGTKKKDGDTYIVDLRIYNEKWPETNLLTANPWRTLSLNNPYKIDTVRFNELKIAPSNISFNNLKKLFGEQKIPFRTNIILVWLFYLFLFLGVVFFLRSNIPTLILVTVGSIVLSLPVIKSGLVYSFGMGFWGPNGHDGIWHLSLINQLSKFSFFHPTFSGEKLKNYHFAFDLLAAFLHKLTHVPSINIYFQMIPPAIAALTGILSYLFVKKLTNSKKAGCWSTFFVYFGGSLGWVLGKGESTFWANQAISLLINPPFALSIVVLLFGLIKFIDYLNKPSFKNLSILSFIFSTLIIIKVYAGIIIISSLFGVAIISFFLFRSKTNSLWKLFLGTLLISIAFFLPFNSKASSLLVFSPLWFLETMVSSSDRLGWFKLANAMSAYSHSGKYFKGFLAQSLALLIFIVGNLGTRIVGVREWIKNPKKMSETSLFCLLGAIVSLVIPLLFIQKGNPWNTIQFFYYFQFFMAIFAGIFIGKLWEIKAFSKTKKIFLYVFSVLIIFLTVPTSFITLKDNYLPSRSPSRISVEELEALSFLSKKEDGVVLTYPFNSDWKQIFSEPRPLYAYETTAYVSALGDKPVFLEDEMNLEISGYKWDQRRQESQRFFLSSDQKWARSFIKENKIKYIYLVKGQKMNFGLGDIKGEKVFENGEVVIYEVN